MEKKSRKKPEAEKRLPAVYVRLTEREINGLDALCRDGGEYRADVIRRILAEYIAKIPETHIGVSNATANGYGHRSG